MFKKLMFFIMLLFSVAVIAKPIRIVAAENFYGDIARQIGGQYVEVFNILNNPNQDPHLFSANIATAKAITDADLIVYNGIDYDPWIENLIATDAQKNKSIIIVAHLANKKPGDNPHIWYDPDTMLIYAKDLTQKLINLDNAHQNEYQQNLREFKQQYQKLLDKINTVKDQYTDISIIATEPVFTEMSDRLGFKMFGKKFQLSIMNNTSPSVDETKDFEDLLRQHKVKLLIYNKQVSNPVTQRMQKIAQQSGIPLLGVSETQPMNENYFSWMTKQLNDLEKVLK